MQQKLQFVQGAFAMSLSSNSRLFETARLAFATVYMCQRCRHLTAGIIAQTCVAQLTRLNVSQLTTNVSPIRPKRIDNVVAQL